MAFIKQAQLQVQVVLILRLTQTEKLTNRVQSPWLQIPAAPLLILFTTLLAVRIFLPSFQVN